MILRTKNERYRKNIKAQEKYHLERIKDEGSLLDNEPELCKEWDYKKTPNNLLTKSNFIVWWKCNKGHSWEAKISNRVKGSGCLYCKGKKIGYGNDFQSLYPHLSKFWNKKNGEKKPSDYVPKSNKKFWWKCDEGHEMFRSPLSMKNRKILCDECN